MIRDAACSSWEGGTRQSEGNEEASGRIRDTLYKVNVSDVWMTSRIVCACAIRETHLCKKKNSKTGPGERDGRMSKGGWKYHWEKREVRRKVWNEREREREGKRMVFWVTDCGAILRGKFASMRVSEGKKNVVPRAVNKEKWGKRRIWREWFVNIRLGSSISI